MIFTSVYTDHGNYPQLAIKLRDSLKKWGVLFRIDKITTEGGAPPPHNFKAQHILRVLCEVRQPICWLDIDCEVVQPPVLLFQNTHDFAVYNWYADSGNHLGLPYDPTRLMASGGVQYYGYTAPALELAFRWANRLTMDLREDDLVLDSVFNESRPPVNPLWLPRNYNRMAYHWPDVEPVINHDYTGGQHARGGIMPVAAEHQGQINPVPHPPPVMPK